MKWKVLLFTFLLSSSLSQANAASLTLLPGHTVNVSGTPMPGGPIVQPTQVALPANAAATDAFVDLELGLLKAASLVPHLGGAFDTPDSYNGSATAYTEFGLLYSGATPLVIAAGQLRFDITAAFLAAEFSSGGISYASQNILQANLMFGVNGTGSRRYTQQVRQGVSVTSYPSSTGLPPVAGNQPVACAGCAVTNGFTSSGGTVGLLASEITLVDGDVLNIFAQLYVQSGGDANTRGNIGQLSLMLDEPVDIFGTEFATDLQWITAVPLPASAWLFMSAVAGLMLPRLRGTARRRG